MSEGKPPRVGVRELRQNLSVYLDRVKDGESLEVTERGKVVARLSQSRGAPSSYEQMLEDGRISRASGTLADLGVPSQGSGKLLSDLIREQRDEDAE
jgi:antitoxin (DNA-binding transcriptional repressor) of toxin-antitoxin stability system